MDWVQPIVKSWLATIKRANDYKRREFSDDAEEAMRFFDGPHDFMYQGSYIQRHGGWGTDDAALPSPTFRMTFNKVAEMVQLFGPSLYHRNPFRQVNPATLPEIPMELMGDPQDPMAQLQMQQFQQSSQVKNSRAGLLQSLLQFYLNYTPNELDLRTHSRKAINEALIKGCGLLWPEVYTPPGGGTRLVGSFYDSIDNLVLDPDMEDLMYAKWAARRRVLPVYEVERRFDIKRGTMRGNLESANRQAQQDADQSYEHYRRRGDTHDLFTYWEIYSRMGFGQNLRNYAERRQQSVVDQKLERFGQYIFLAVSEDYQYPLNIPEHVCESGSEREIFLRTQWPTPFWADPTHPWPFSEISFHHRPRCVWPMSHVKPALGEIRFLNWCFSFIADKIKNTSRDFIAALKSAGEELKTSLLSGRDLTLLEIESPNRTVQEVVQFLQHPQMNKDIWTIMEAMMGVLERRIGLNELIYGESRRQLRSSAEAQIKGDAMSIRPDDMAECVENAMTRLARKEAIATYWHIYGQHMAPIIGQDRAVLWDQIVQQSTLQQIVMELDYRIEAGSIRKPNRKRDQENANNAVQQWTPLFTQWMQTTMDVTPINGLLEMWAKAYDQPPEKFVLRPPPPQPNPEEQKMQLEMQKMQAELEMKQAEMRLKAMEAQAGIEHKTTEQQMDMELDQERHDQDMRQDREKHLLEMLQMRQEGTLKLDLAERQAEANIEAKKKQAAAAAKQKTASNGSKT